MIYLITCQKTKTCKIGFSLQPDKRLFQLQTGNPNELELISVIDGDMALEKELHEKFKDYKIKGEWFKYCREIESFFNIDANSQNKFTELMTFCYNNLTLEDFARVSVMSINCYGSSNIVCHSNKTPYKEEDLASFLKLSKDRFVKFVRLIKKHNILHIQHGLFMGKVQNVYMLNPYLSRKRKTFDDKLVNNYFKNLAP